MVIDPQKMSAAERHNYIFGIQKNYYVVTRFGWFESLESDIRTLIEGGQYLKNIPSIELGGHFGAGNVSIPILICIGLELASALYTGKTNVKDKSEYHADENVRQFVETYFPKQGVKIPLLIWDGIRNGNTHLFMPKIIKVNDTIVKFTFGVSMSPYKLSYVLRRNNDIHIMFNGIEFYRIFRSAIEQYGRDLEHDDTLQNNFINAWESIDNTPHDLSIDICKIPKEIRRLSSRLQFSERIDIFSNTHKGLLSSTYYRDRPHKLTQLLRLILQAL
jgi:hypothetical protein